MTRPIIFCSQISHPTYTTRQKRMPIRYGQFSPGEKEVETWTSGLIVVILLLLIMPTVVSMMGYKVSRVVEKKVKDAKSESLTSRRNSY
jgi:hypothetical protein